MLDRVVAIFKQCKGTGRFHLKMVVGASAGSKENENHKEKKEKKEKNKEKKEKEWE